MKKLSLLFFLFILSISLTIHAQTGERIISTLGESTINTWADQAIINLTISGEGKNRSQVYQEVKRDVDSFLKELIRVTGISDDNILLEEFYWDDNDHLKREGQHRYKTSLIINVDDMGQQSLYYKTSKLLSSIVELDPSRKRVSYNRPVDLKYNITDAYYRFSGAKDHKKRLFEESLKDSKESLDILLELMELELVQFASLEEIVGSNIYNYREEIDIEKLHSPKLRIIEYKVKVNYRVQ